jgi:hypothetical protein
MITLPALRFRHFTWFLARLPAFVHHAGGPLRFAAGAARHAGRGAATGLAGYMRDTLPWYLCTGYGVARRDAAAELARAQGRHGYIIVAPGYSQRSAGKQCLYLLCDRLNRLGYPSYITGSETTAAHLDAPLLRWEDAREAMRGGRFVAVYPEIVSGNPLGARKVARWVMNRPGALGGDARYDPAEQVFYYSDALRPHIADAVAGKLQLPVLDDTLFYPGALPPEQRTLDCFYVGKSSWKDGYFDRKEAVEITRSSPERSELGKLFRAARCLYTFDNLTALVLEALLCDCPVVIIPDGSFDRSLLSSSELGAEGIAWGIEEKGASMPRPDLMRERLAALRLEFERQLQRFIQATAP